MKIHITPQDVPHEPLVDRDVLTQAGHVLVADASDADVVVNLCLYSSMYFLNHRVEGTNVIMVSLEPFISRSSFAVESVYTKEHLYHSVFRFGSCDGNKRSFPVTEDPIAYPYHPYCGWRDLRRVDTTLRRKRVFFAGMMLSEEEAGPRGTTNLYRTRTRLVGDLPQHGVDVYAEGAGYGNDSRNNGFLEGWDIVKLELTQKVHADFHLCMENCQLKNYISEKIHHGFQSDLVVLYLGNPEIDKWVPPEVFINLNDYYDPEKQRINVGVVADIIKSMTQEEYDRIIHAAREWRDSADFDARFAAQAKRLSNMIVARIEEVGADADHGRDVQEVQEG